MKKACVAGFAAVLLTGLCAPVMAADAPAAGAKAAGAKPAESKPGPGPKPARTPDGHPNWNGFWVRPGGLMEVYRGPSGLAGTPVGTNAGPPIDMTQPALKSPYKEQYDVSVEALKKGPVPDKVALCYPNGMPGVMGMIYGMDVLQTSNQIALTSEWQAETRRIWLDRKEHPPADELDATYEGDSVGHWEGDVLVVDTVGLRPDVPFRHQLPFMHSENTRIIERFYQKTPDLLVDEMTIIDPEVFVAPWKREFTYRYRPDLRIREYVCLDNNRNVDESGRQSFK